MRKHGWAYNRCGSCGRFKPWEELYLHFVPDTAFSSEDESWQECDDCAGPLKTEARRQGSRSVQIGGPGVED